MKILTRPILLAGICAACAWAAPTVTPIWAFKGAMAGPQSLVSHHAALYGTNPYGGVNGWGTVFQLTPPAQEGGAWNASFYNIDPNIDGTFVSPTVTFDNNGGLYGTTNGGAGGCGTVFQLTPPAAPGGVWGHAVLYTFESSPDSVLGPAYTGAQISSVVFSGGALYGVVYSGAYGYGVVFQLAPASAPAGEWSFTTLYSFAGDNDGIDPSSITADNAGNIYGAAYAGVEGTYGTAFQVAPPATPGGAWTETTLYMFAGGSDGEGPIGLTPGSNGSLYGVTWWGGAGSCQDGAYTGCGTVFELSPPAEPGGAWAESILYHFLGNGDGEEPNPGLSVASDGTIYGSTRLDGEIGCPACAGTVFQLSQTAAGWTEATLYQFGTGVDAASPAALALNSDGSLFVATGEANGGLMKLTPPSAPGGSWIGAAVYDFAPYSDGAEPSAGLTFDTQGAIYGTTQNGGTAGCSCGTVFRMTPPQAAGQPWTETLLYSFMGGSDGEEPISGVVADSSGTLYGTTYSGGKLISVNPAGTAFELTPPLVLGGTWTKTVLHNFGSAEDGAGPNGALVFGARGELYGTTANTGAILLGTVFQLTPPKAPGAAWTERVIYSFGARGSSHGPVALAFNNGVLYGVSAGNDKEYGSVFTLTPPAVDGAQWNLTVLHNFTGQGDGAYPTATLLFDDNGSIYGTTALGGGPGCYTEKYASGCGVVFQLTPPALGGGRWTENTLFNFSQSEGALGSLPNSLAFLNGTIYGTTCHTGRRNMSPPENGVLFQLTPPLAAGDGWAETTLSTFTTDQGTCPSGLVSHNGVLYGTAPSGGPLAGGGTLFRVMP